MQHKHAATHTHNTHILPKDELPDIAGEHGGSGEHGGVGRAHDGSGDGAKTDEGDEGRREVLDDEWEDHGCVVTGNARRHLLTLQVRGVPVCGGKIERSAVMERGRTGMSGEWTK